MPRRRPHLFSGGDGDDPARRRRGLHYVASTGAARGARAGEAGYLFALISGDTSSVLISGRYVDLPCSRKRTHPPFAIATYSPSPASHLLLCAREAAGGAAGTGETDPCLCIYSIPHSPPDEINYPTPVRSRSIDKSRTCGAPFPQIFVSFSSGCFVRGSSGILAPAGVPSVWQQQGPHRGDRVLLGAHGAGVVRFVQVNDAIIAYTR